MKRTLVFITILLALANTALFIRTFEIHSKEIELPESKLEICDRNTYASEVHCLTNYARAENSLPLFTYSPELEEVSKQKSNEMCELGYFSHDLGERDWTYFIKNSGIKYSKAGENLARGYQTAPEAVQALLESPKHYQNIMGDYTHLGVYMASCDGKNYTTQTFAKMASRE